MNQTAAKKTKAKTPATTILLIVLLALAAIILALSLINNIGIIGRLDKSVKSDNYSLSKNQIQVLKFQNQQNIYQNLYYNCLYYSYGIGGSDTFGDLSSYKNNPAQYAQDHLKYYDFDALAYSSAESLLVYCEGARAAGVTLSQDELESEENLEKVGAINLASLQSGADSNGQTLSAYIKACMGEGVSKGDVEDVIEKTLLADKFYQQKVEELKSAVTEEDAEKYREDNKSSFYFTKYASYTLKTEDWAEEAKKADSVKAIKKLITDKLFESEYEKEYAKIFVTDKGETETEAEAETGTETTTTPTATDETPEQTKADVLATILHWNGLDDGHDGEDHEEPAFDDSNSKDEYKKAGYNLATALDTIIKKELDKVSEESQSYYADPKGSGASDAQKWLFDEGRKGNDHTVITTESTSTDKDGKETTSKTSTWYFVAEDSDVMQIDTEKTRKGYYVQLTDDTDDKISATDKVKRTIAEKLKLFEDAADQEARIKVLTDILGASEQSSISSSVLSSKEELKDWFFSDDRKDGDFGKVSVKVNSTSSDKDEETVTNEYAVLYLGANEENWLISAKESVASERLQTWYDEMKESCHLTMDYEMPTSAETTGAGTATEADATSARDTDTEPASEPASETESDAATDSESESAAA